MNYFQQIEIAQSGLIWTALCVVMIFLLEYRTIRPQFVVPQQYIDTATIWLQRLVRWMIYLLAALLPLHITLPTFQYTLERTPFPVYVLLDSSLSMSADDVQPSRFIVAQELIAGSIAQIEGVRVGLIIFSGIPFELIPLSSHIDAVVQRIQEVSLADFPITTEFVGTAVGDALLIARERLRDHDTGAIILISDGASSRGVDAMQAAYLADESGIPIYTVAIGQDDFVVGNDNQGNEVIAAYEIEHLQTIAQMSKGEFYLLEDADELPVRISDLVTELTDDQELDYRVERITLNRYLVPVLLLFLLIYVAWKGTVLFHIRKKQR